MPGDAQLHLLALCALDGVSGVQWQVIARQARTHAGLNRLLEGLVDEFQTAAVDLATNLDRGLDDLDKARQRAQRAVAAAADVDARLVTVLDAEYPSNLQEIYDRPPFLFVQGELDDADVISVALVGTRAATDGALRQTGRLAREFTQRDVTVISGLAAGVEAAAHSATVEAGGRTVAVLGTGILGSRTSEQDMSTAAAVDAAEDVNARTLRLRPFSSQTQQLQQRIVSSGGAVVSQFWPRTARSRDASVARRVVTAGLARATVIVDASGTAPAKRYARLANDQRRALFVLPGLATDRKWIRDYVAAGKALEANNVDEVVDRIRPAERVESTPQTER